MPWNIGTKVEFQNPLSKDAHGLKRKYELLLFEFFLNYLPFSRNFIVFFCTDPCASRDLIEHITQSSELHFCCRASLNERKLEFVSDTLEACYHYKDQAETRKITNTYKVFFVLRLRASGMMPSL